MSISNTDANFHNSAVKPGSIEQQLPFPTAEQEAASLEAIRQEIFKHHAGLMAICKQANLPTSIRNLISALIKLSGGEIVVRANDFEIASVFYQDETKRDALKKKVQRWRKALDKWQNETDTTLVQFRSGHQITSTDGRGNTVTKNEKTEYRLIILDLAAKVLASGKSNMDAAARAVLLELSPLPSRLEDTRKNPLTVGRCLNTSTSWIRKTFEIAHRDGELKEVVDEMLAELRNLFDEFFIEDESEGGTHASYLELNGETFLDTRSTIITSYSSINDSIPNTDTSNDEVEIEDSSYTDLSNKKTKASDDKEALPNAELDLMPRIQAKEVSSLSLLEQALSHAHRGFRVFPVYKMRNGVCSCRYGEDCPTPAKHPCITNWNNEATTDETKIRKWWRKFRNANIGIATGDYTDEHILVALDVDIKADGFESLELLETKFGKLPETLTAITGSNGRHFIFLARRGLDIRNLQASLKLGQGLDIRGLNGFIVAAGSVHLSGNRYEWIDENVPVSEMPEWLVEKLTAAVEVKAFHASSSGNGSIAAVPYPNFNNITVVREHEGRNNFLFVKALHLFRDGYDRQTVTEQIASINSQVCEPPIGEIEMKKLVDSAEKRHPLKP